MACVAIPIFGALRHQIAGRGVFPPPADVVLVVHDTLFILPVGRPPAGRRCPSDRSRGEVISGVNSLILGVWPLAPLAKGDPGVRISRWITALDSHGACECSGEITDCKLLAINVAIILYLVVRAIIL